MNNALLSDSMTHRLETEGVECNKISYTTPYNTTYTVPAGTQYCYHAAYCNIAGHTDWTDDGTCQGPCILFHELMPNKGPVNISNIAIGILIDQSNFIRKKFLL